MKGYMTKRKFLNRFGVCALSLFVIVGLLTILNTSLNLSLPATNNDDSDSVFIQINTAPNSNKYSAWEQIAFNIPATERTKIVSLSTIYNPVSRFTIYNDSEFNMRLRAPPLDTGFFGWS